MSIVKRLGFLVVMCGMVLSGAAHADALADAKSRIDIWIKTLDASTAGGLKPSASFSSDLKAFLETVPCKSKSEVAKVEAYIHKEINNLQHTHKVKYDYGINTECRPASGQAARGKPVELKMAAHVTVRGYQVYHQSKDEKHQADLDQALKAFGCTRAQVQSPQGKACLGLRSPKDKQGNSVHHTVVCNKSQPQCCTMDQLGRMGTCIALSQVH